MELWLVPLSLIQRDLLPQNERKFANLYMHILSFKHSIDKKTKENQHKVSFRHENESLGKNPKMHKNGQKCLKKPENQQSRAQKNLHSGLYPKILMPDPFYWIR